MDFSKIQHLKPHAPLKVIERDLSENPEINNKVTLDPEDVLIDYTSERLQKAEIEIPIFKQLFIRPFLLKGLFAQYFMTYLGGGFYEFVFQYGKISPKPSDRRHPDKEIDRKNGGEIKFWIGYNHEKRHYYAIDEEAVFQKKYAVVEQLLFNDEMFQLLADFQRFITHFHSNVTGVAKTMVQNYHDIFVYLKHAIPMLRDYHTLLNIMLDIDDVTLAHNVAFFTKWEQQLEHHLEHIQRHLDLHWTLDEARNHWAEFSPISNFYGTIETGFWKAGYYIDPFKDGIYPNFLEIHNQRQLAKGQVFESDETLRQKEKELYAKHIETAQSKQQVLFVKSE